MNDVMIDIETLGRSNTSVIAQIAAVQFDALSGQIGKEFNCFLDIEDAQKMGCTIDASTVLFWLNQRTDVITSVFGNAEKLPLFDALLDFNNFLLEVEAENLEKPILWANSPSFDIEILKHAYSVCDMINRIDFRNERDFRTISKLLPEIAKNHERLGVLHNALDDCYNQIEILGKCYRKLFSK